MNDEIKEMTLDEVYTNRAVIKLASEIAHERHPHGFNMEKLLACAPDAIQRLGITIVEEDTKGN